MYSIRKWRMPVNSDPTNITLSQQQVYVNAPSGATPDYRPSVCGLSGVNVIPPACSIRGRTRPDTEDSDGADDSTQEVFINAACHQLESEPPPPKSDPPL